MCESVCVGWLGPHWLLSHLVWPIRPHPLGLKPPLYNPFKPPPSYKR